MDDSDLELGNALRALRKIAKGSGLVLLGTIMSLVLGFLSRIVLARGFSVSDYGAFNLAIAVLSFLGLLVTLGLPEGIAREVSYYKVKDPGRVESIVSVSFFLASVASIVGCVSLFFASGVLAGFLHVPVLLFALRVLSFALPFQALLTLVVSIARGFGRVREKIFFRDIGVSLLWLLGLLFVYFLSLSFRYVFVAYVAAYALSLAALLAYERSRGLLSLSFRSFDRGLVARLLSFSLPLLFTGVMGFVMNWTDTLMLGYFRGPREVGVYNAAAPLARLLTVPLGVAGFMFLPIVSELYARDEMSELRRVYQVTAKWLFLASLPLFAAYMLFPRLVISVVFGAKYVGGSVALVVLSLGFIFHVLMGLNGMSLIALGETKLIALYNLAAAILNVVLSAVLIPVYGIVGAAVATAVSYILGNVLTSLRLYCGYGVAPFYSNYLKTLGAAFLLLAVFRALGVRPPGVLGAVLYMAVFLVLLFLFLVVTRSIDREDVELLHVLRDVLAFYK